MDTSDSCKSSLPGEISSAEQRVVKISSTGSPAQPAVTGPSQNYVFKASHLVFSFGKK